MRDASICHEGRVKELIAIARRAFAWRVVQTNHKVDIDNIRKLTYAGQAKSRKLSWGELLISRRTVCVNVSRVQFFFRDLVLTYTQKKSGFDTAENEPALKVFQKGS